MRRGVSATVSGARKFLVAVIGAVITAGALGLLSDPYDKWTAVLAAFCAAAGVYQVRNS